MSTQQWSSIKLVSGTHSLSVWLCAWDCYQEGNTEHQQNSPVMKMIRRLKANKALFSAADTPITIKSKAHEAQARQQASRQTAQGQI